MHDDWCNTRTEKNFCQHVQSTACCAFGVAQTHARRSSEHTVVYRMNSHERCDVSRSRRADPCTARVANAMRDRAPHALRMRCATVHRTRCACDAHAMRDGKRIRDCAAPNGVE
jgi:hypothetical protein